MTEREQYLNEIQNGVINLDRAWEMYNVFPFPRSVDRNTFNQLFLQFIHNADPLFIYKSDMSNYWRYFNGKYSVMKLIEEETVKYL